MIVISVPKTVPRAQKYLSNDLNEFCAMGYGPTSESMDLIISESLF